MVQKLYILIRTDMESMTVGRIAAQASHAANQFVGELHDEIASRTLTASVNNQFDSGKQLKRYYEKWHKQTDNYFGTVIVLDGGSRDRIMDFLEKLNGNKYFGSVVIDPDYPIRDGETVHIVKDVLTCAYVFPIHSEEGNEELADFFLL